MKKYVIGLVILVLSLPLFAYGEVISSSYIYGGTLSTSQTEAEYFDRGFSVGLGTEILWPASFLDMLMPFVGLDCAYNMAFINQDAPGWSKFYMEDYSILDFDVYLGLSLNLLDFLRPYASIGAGFYGTITEKDQNGLSALYSLADFIDDEGNRIRKDERYEKNYLIGKYGAIPTLETIDFLKEQKDGEKRSNWQ